MRHSRIKFGYACATRLEKKFAICWMRVACEQLTVRAATWIRIEVRIGGSIVSDLKAGS
jgi:hypothetical protein